MGTLIITGASGWLGKGLMARFCSSGIEGYTKITAIVKNEEEVREVKKLTSNANVQTVICDLSHAISSERALTFDSGSHLIHAAGVIHPRKVADFYHVNVNGTRNILNAARVGGVEKITVVSSNSVNGVSRNKNHIFNEESKLAPYMHYGRSKVQMEELVKQSASNFDQVTTVRAPWFYGPHQPARQTQFFSMIKNGKFPLFGRADNLRSMVYIENLIDGILLSLRPRKTNFDTFWIADEKPYSMLEIVQTVSDVLLEDFNINVKQNKIFLPKFIPQVAQAADFTMQSVGLYNQKIHVLSEMNKTIACDISKAKELLKYNPKYSLRAGMKSSVAWLIDKKVEIK